MSLPNLFGEIVATDPGPLSVYDWIVVNSSGGKDSQAMLDLVCQRAEAESVLSRVVVVHADLGRVEWQGTREIAQAQAECYGVPFVAVWRRQGDLLNQIESRGKFPGPSTRFCTAHHKQNQVERVFTALSTEHSDPQKTAGDLLTQIEERGKFPDAARRFCTSDHKRAQVPRLFTRLTDKFRAPLEPVGNKIRPCRILNCLGMRAEESPRRSKMLPLEPDTAASNGKREVTRWLPLHGWKESEVWERLHSCRSKEHIHYAYALGMPRVSCCFCFSGDTEIVTRQGIRAIHELDGTAPDLLVPVKTPLGISGAGTFVPAPVRSYGVQQLWEVKLTRGRQEKTIMTTGNHRWFCAERRIKRDSTGRHKGYDPTTVMRETSQLEPGHKLRDIRATAMESSSGIVPFAVAQGFVFGDGSVNKGDDRPATVTFHHDANGGKDSALLKFFAAHEIQPITANGRPAYRIYGLPRLWKESPNFRESRSFLLSWLAGYFAADGTTAESGVVRLDSAKREHIEIARSIAAICGVGYGPIRETWRVGTGTEKTSIYSVSLSAATLPAWFFLIEAHKRHTAIRESVREKHTRHWKVESVTALDRYEPVYCAEVPEVAAFALSDEILTGNCIFAPREALIIAGRHNPELLAEYVRVEEKIGHKFRQNLTMAQVKAAVDAGEVPQEVPTWTM